MRVADFLAPGEINAITAPKLAGLLGVSERDLRKLIRSERLRGGPILSSKFGYFLPASVDDLRRFSRSLNHRIAEIQKIAVEAERCVARAEGQMMVEGF